MPGGRLGFEDSHFYLTDKTTSPLWDGGAGGIRTLARFYPPNPLAGGPLEPLGYRSKSKYEEW